MPRKAWCYLSVAAICLVPLAAAAEDPSPAGENAAQDSAAAGTNADQDFSLEGEKGAGEGGEFGIEEAAPKPPPPPWETQRELEYSSEIEAGVLYNSADSFKHGEYTGLTDDAPYGVGNFDIRLRSPYDSEDAAYIQAEGANLGLDSRDVRVEGGSQGSFMGYVEFDQIPKFLNDSAQTPFVGAGSTNLTLPSNWVGGGTTAALTNLRRDLQPLELSYDRKRGSAGFSVIPAPHWEFRADYMREWKDGTQSIGGIFGTDTGRAALLPQPINYLTDEATATLAYADDTMQGELSYYVSLFNNEDPSLTWRNPFTAPGGAASFPTGVGAIGLPPDNEFHQINFSGGYNIDPETRTRANLDVAYGWMLQNDTFLPYTANPVYAASIVNPLPRNSLNGEINTTLVNLRLTSQPRPDVHLRGGYRFDDRDNQTPVNFYNYIRTDAQNQDTPLTSARWRANRPYSYAMHKADVEGDYDFLPRTTGTLGYEFETIHRDLQEVARTDEHTGLARLKTTPVDFATVVLKGAYGERRGSEYEYANPFFVSRTPERIDSIDPGDRWEIHPLLRKFYEADRDRIRFGGDLLLNICDNFTFGLRTDLLRDDYPDSYLGLRSRDSDSYSLDASYMPVANVTTYAFYNLINVDTGQAGRQHGGAFNFENANNDWFVGTEDVVHTLGAGVDWWVIENELDVNADYAYSFARTDYEFLPGANLVAAPVPTLESALHSAGVTGTYHLRKDVAVKLGYRFEKYRTYDWAIDNVAVDSMANVLSFGDISPDYTVHMVGVSVVLNFTP